MTTPSGDRNMAGTRQFTRTRRKALRWRTGPAGIRVPHFGTRLGRRALAFVLLAPALTLMLIYVVYPVVDVIYSSMRAWDTPTVAGAYIGLDNYKYLVEARSNFAASFGRSVYWTLGSVVVQTAFGLGIAMLLNMRLPGHQIARAAVLIPFVVPAVVVSLVWQNLLNELTGVINYLLVVAHVVREPVPFLTSRSWTMDVIILIGAWKLTPFMIVLFLARLQSVPKDQVEAARCDGANAFQIFRHIVFPWMLPVMVIAVLLRTIWSFNEFDIPFLLTQGGPDGSTLVLPVLIRQLLLEQLDPGLAAAISVLMIALLSLIGLGYLVIYRRGEAVLTTN
jgi:multiple sugar transport system permease protein